MQVIAIVDVETVDNKSVVKSVSPFDANVISADTFVADWNSGQQARQQWEQFCNALCCLLMESGFIDETGLHIDEYNAGSIFRFIHNNPTIIPESFRSSMIGTIVMGAVKRGARDIKKGKEITINWASIDQHTGPMTAAVLGQMMLNPARQQLLQPLLDQYAQFIILPTATEPATDATE